MPNLAGIIPLGNSAPRGARSALGSFIKSVQLPVEFVRGAFRMDAILSNRSSVDFAAPRVPRSASRLA